MKHRFEGMGKEEYFTLQQERKSRICAMYDCLVSRSMVHSQAELAREAGINTCILSRAMNGNIGQRAVTVMHEINNRFRIFRTEWINTGKGDMLSGEMPGRELNSLIEEAYRLRQPASEPADFKGDLLSRLSNISFQLDMINTKLSVIVNGISGRR